MLLYCGKIGQFVDGVTTCLMRASGCIPRSRCSNCSISPYVLISKNSRYIKWPDKLTINSLYEQEWEDKMGAVFDSQGRVVLQGAIVKVTNQRDWMAVVDILPTSSHKKKPKVRLRSQAGDVITYSLGDVRVISSPGTNKVGNKVRSAANPSIIGEITKFWERPGDDTRWALIDTASGSRVEKASLLIPVEKHKILSDIADKLEDSEKVENKPKKKFRFRVSTE